MQLYRKRYVNVTAVFDFTRFIANYYKSSECGIPDTKLHFKLFMPRSENYIHLGRQKMFNKILFFIYKSEVRRKRRTKNDPIMSDN